MAGRPERERWLPQIIHRGYFRGFPNESDKVCYVNLDLPTSGTDAIWRSSFRPSRAAGRATLSDVMLPLGPAPELNRFVPRRDTAMNLRGLRPDHRRQDLLDSGPASPDGRDRRGITIRSLRRC